MEKQNKVIAKLVKSYDLSPSGSHDVKSIHYFNIYEFEYNGKKYNYSEIINDNFDKNFSEIELFFDDDPNHAYRVDIANNEKMSKNEKYIVFIFIFIMVCIFIYFIITSLKYVLKNPLISIFYFFIFIFVFLLSKSKTKKKKNLNQLLDEALKENRFADAYLKKSTYLHYDSDSKEYYDKMIRNNPYKAKYVYEYNGKKYYSTFYFAELPPNVIKVFFEKNPKKVFYFTK